MTAANRTSGVGGPGTAAITNDDVYTYVEAENGFDDFNNNSYDKVKDARSY
jgi:hypothetical protein